VIFFSVLAFGLLVGVIMLIPLGLRAGDRVPDAALLSVEPRIAPRGATVTLTNPGPSPVILGISLRRAGPRLLLEAGSYVRLRTGATAADVRADQQSVVAALDGGETGTFVIPAGLRVRRRAELVVVVGQPGRLRTIHRLVCLPLPGRDEARHQVGEPGLQPLER
jgi:hypothetical protein